MVLFRYYYFAHSDSIVVFTPKSDKIWPPNNAMFSRFIAAVFKHIEKVDRKSVPGEKKLVRFALVINTV